MSLENYRNLGDPRALYWAEYRQTHETFTPLKPGERVTDHVLLSFIAGYNFLPTHFDLRKKDGEPFSGVPHPGKSAHIAFSYDLRTIYGAILDREPRGGESAGFATAGELTEIGFYTFFAPSPNTPLHVRVVHEVQIENPYREDTPLSIKSEIGRTIK